MVYASKYEDLHKIKYSDICNSISDDDIINGVLKWIVLHRKHYNYTITPTFLNSISMENVEYFIESGLADHLGNGLRLTEFGITIGKELVKLSEL